MAGVRRSTQKTCFQPAQQQWAESGTVVCFTASVVPLSRPFSAFQRAQTVKRQLRAYMKRAIVIWEPFLRRVPKQIAA